MNKAVPWSIKGVDFDAREAAKEAARRSGMTLGEWLNSVIAEQAAELGVDVEDVDEAERLEAVASRLARMSRGGPSVPQRVRRPQPMEEPVRPQRTRPIRQRPDHERDYERGFSRERDVPRDTRDNQRDPYVEREWDRDSERDRGYDRDRPRASMRDVDPEQLLDQAIQSFERGTRHHAQRTTAALSRVVERLEEIEEKLDDRKPVGRGDARATLAKIQERLEEQALTREPSRRVEPEASAARAPLPQPGPVNDGFARLEAKLTSLIETLTEQAAPPAAWIETLSNPAPAANAARSASAPARAQRRPAERRPVAPLPPPRPVAHASIADAVAQITRRQRELEGISERPAKAPSVSHAALWAPIPEHAQQVSPAQPVPDFGSLQKEIASLSSRLEETRREIIERDERRQKAVQQRAKEPAPSDPGPEVAMLRRQIEDLSKGFAQLASRENLSSLESAIRDLTQRVEASRQGGIGENILRPVEELAADIRRSLSDLPAASAFEVIEGEIRSLRSRLDAMQANSFDPRTFGDLQTQTAEIRAMLSQALAQPVSADSIERKIAGLTDRVDLLARHGSNPIDSAAVIQSIGDIRGTLDAALGNGILAQLAARMDALAQRLESAALAPPAVDRLSERIDVLGRKIEDAVSQSNASDHFDRLSQRIETVQRSLEGRPDLAPTNIDTSALESMMRELAEKLERPAPAPASDMRSVSALHQEITRLADQIERVAPAVDTRRIEEMVLHLSDKLEHAGAPASDIALAEALSEQIAQLSSRVDSVSQAPDRAMAEDLRSEMANLARQIEAGQASVDNRVLEEVRQQISLLSDRLQVGDESARVLASLETAVGDLFGRIDDMRDATMGAAESAARVAAREAVREVLDVQPAAPGGPSESLSRELLDLRSMQDAADRRTHSTLTAVHETLEKIVDRLAMLEEDFAEVRPEPLAPAARPASRMDMPQEPLASGPAPSFMRSRPGGDVPPVSVRPPEARPRSEPVAPSIDDLMEPGSGMPVSRRGNELQPAPPSDGQPEVSKQASFIAAARRAAQSAMGGSKKSKAEKNPKPDVARMDASLDAMLDARERAKAAHLAALSEVAAATAKTSDMPATPALGRVRAFVNDHRRAVFAGLACIATILGTLQAIRLLRPPEQVQAIVEYSTPAAPSPRAAPVPDIPKQEPPAAEPQRQGALDTSAPKVAGNFLQAPVDLSQPQRFVAASQPSAATDQTVTNSIAPAPSLGRLSLNVAAAGGQANAQFELASRYADGRGVARDPQQARQWFEKAAQQNLAPAQFRLGALYERGVGVDRNLQKAHDLYLRAANQGNVRSMHNLAVLSAEGVDGKPDYATAASWFQKAAEYGIRDSQYNLAILMARGLGVEQNLKQSWMWFALAAAQGDTDAEKKRDEVGARLDVKDLAAARILFEAFRNKTPVSAANDVAAPAGGWDLASPAPPARSETKADATPPAAKPAVRGKVSSL